MAGPRLLATISPMPDLAHFNRTFARLRALGRHRWLMSSRTDPAPVRATDYAALTAGWGALLRRRARRRPRQGRRARPRGRGAAASAWPPSRCPSSSPRRRSTPGCACPSSRSTPTAARPKGTGVRYAVGELLTCTRCVGVWSALGLTALRVTRPREARVVNAVLGASAINDVAQAGFTLAVPARSNAAQADATGRLEPSGGARPAASAGEDGRGRRPRAGAALRVHGGRPAPGARRGDRGRRRAMSTPRDRAQADEPPPTAAGG